MTSRNKIKISLLNPQGHIRFKNTQIACHPDTGGQIVYILEVAKEMSRMGYKVDILTRYFKDPEWPGYARKTESWDENLRIVRIKCGPDDKFVPKEELWPIINEFACGIEEFYKKTEYQPDIFTSHYADAGLAAAFLKINMQKPFVHTGHSLGGKKMDNLQLSGSNFRALNDLYKFHLRIAAERISFRNSSAIIASTNEEIKKQYGHKVYRGVIKKRDKFHVIPPGISPKQFFSYQKREKNAGLYRKASGVLARNIRKNIYGKRVHLPCIFSAARFDAKKNAAGLIRAYAGSRILQKKFNLLIVAGNVKDPLNPLNRDKFTPSQLKVVDRITELIRKFSLQGKVVVSQGFDYETELPYIYRYGARSGWIFVNPALHEPFGLTVVEAMASGLPVVATKHGGPADILLDEEYGLLVEPTDWHSISSGIEKMSNKRTWNRFSKMGIDRVKESYTWKAAARSRIEVIEEAAAEEFSRKNDFDIPGYFADPAVSSEKVLITELKRKYYIGGSRNAG